MQINNAHRIQTNQLDVPPRLLLGPGPSNAHPRVLQALSMRQVGHLDPKFIELMNENQELLRYAWQTDNQFTIPVSGAGSAPARSSTARSLAVSTVNPPVMMPLPPRMAERMTGALITTW